MHGHVLQPAARRKYRVRSTLSKQQSIRKWWQSTALVRGWSTTGMCHPTDRRPLVSRKRSKDSAVLGLLNHRSPDDELPSA
nr:hypothetical protein CFP56_34850 [Quercus suber]